MKAALSIIAVSVLLVGCETQQSASTPSPAPQPAPAPGPTPAPTPAPAYVHDGNDPVSVESRFYQAYATLNHQGLPSESERLMLDPQISPSLSQLLKAAIAADAKRPAAQRFKGDPFTANPSGATQVKPNSCNWGGTPPDTCYPEMSNAAETWKDVPEVNDTEVSPANWRVSDIQYHGTLPGDRTGKLSDLLKQIAKP